MTNLILEDLWEIIWQSILIALVFSIFVTYIIFKWTPIILYHLKKEFKMIQSSLN